MHFDNLERNMLFYNCKIRINYALLSNSIMKYSLSNMKLLLGTLIEFSDRTWQLADKIKVFVVYLFSKFG